MLHGDSVRNVVRGSAAYLARIAAHKRAKGGATPDDLFQAKKPYSTHCMAFRALTKPAWLPGPRTSLRWFAGKRTVAQGLGALKPWQEAAPPALPVFQHAKGRTAPAVRPFRFGIISSVDPDRFWRWLPAPRFPAWSYTACPACPPALPPPARP